MSTLFLFDQRAFEEAIERAVQKALDRAEFSSVHKQGPELMDIKAASQFVGKAVPTLYKLTSERKIPHHKQGRRLYFLRSELEAWIKEGKVKTVAEIQEEVRNSPLPNRKGGRQ